MMQVRKEMYSEELRAEVDELMLAANDEVYEGERVNINWEAIKALAAANLLEVYTVRKDGVLVGHATFQRWPLLFQQHIISGLCLAIFIKKPYRVTAPRLVRFAENDLAHLGVNQVFYMAKEHLGHTRFFARLGYEQHEISYRKLL